VPEEKGGDKFAKISWWFTPQTNPPILYFFNSVAHVWVPGAKTTGPIAKKFGFSST
jgi:hypothetical protein